MVSEISGLFWKSRHRILIIEIGYVKEMKILKESFMAKRVRAKKKTLVPFQQGSGVFFYGDFR
jgi:hypothetical protein